MLGCRRTGLSEASLIRASVSALRFSRSVILSLTRLAGTPSMRACTSRSSSRSDLHERGPVYLVPGVALATQPVRVARVLLAEFVAQRRVHEATLQPL